MPKVVFNDEGFFIDETKIPFVIVDSIKTEQDGGLTLVTMTVASRGYRDERTDSFEKKLKERSAKSYSFEDEL